VAWHLICRPEKKGCLGIINLELQNKTLILKQVPKFIAMQIYHGLS
jgi:hypothetical protein